MVRSYKYQNKIGSTTLNRIPTNPSDIFIFYLNTYIEIRKSHIIYRNLSPRVNDSSEITHLFYEGK